MARKLRFFHDQVTALAYRSSVRMRIPSLRRVILLRLRLEAL